VSEVVYRGGDTLYTVLLADGQPCRVRNTNHLGAGRRAVVGDAVRLSAGLGAFHCLQESGHVA